MVNIRLPYWSRAALWLALLLPATLIGAYALRYVSGDPALLPYELRVNMLHDPVSFVLHTTFGGLALLLGPWQFAAGLRRRRPAVHRAMGRCYIGCCLISGIAAYPVALGTVAGPIASTGFAALATAWLMATLLALRAIRGGRVDGHRRWMIRSYALTLTAVTFRCLLLVPMIFGRLDFMQAYRFSTWAGWLCNLLLAEVWLRVAMPTRAQLMGVGAPHSAGGGAIGSHTSFRE
jgi:uncharacterized membrane protein